MLTIGLDMFNTTNNTMLQFKLRSSSRHHPVLQVLLPHRHLVRLHRPLQAPAHNHLEARPALADTML